MNGITVKKALFPKSVLFGYPRDWRNFNDHVVIRLPRGNFVVVDCTLDIAFDLLFLTLKLGKITGQPCRYGDSGSNIFYLLVSIGMLALSFAQTRSQLLFGASYVIMCCVHSVVACLPYGDSLESFSLYVGGDENTELNRWK
jgi:hypothetical protein